MKIYHRNKNFHQNSIGFTKFIANVREKLAVDKKFLASEKILVECEKIYFHVRKNFKSNVEYKIIRVP